MRIQRLLDYLKYSELANLKLGEVDGDNSENRARVFNYIDRALAAVNVEFDINQTEHIVNLQPTRSKYYINDAKLIKLIAAYYSDGTELTINNENDEESVFTPALNIIEYRGTNVSSTTEEDSLSLIFLKGFDNVTSANDLVAISEGLLECVTNYVAFVAYSSVDMSGDSPAKFFLSRYKDAVQTAKNNGFNIDENTDFDRLSNRGFV
jgi:hypothetical protein